MNEAPGRDRQTDRPTMLALAAVIAAGFVLRVAYLGSGIPFALGIDEPFIMMPVVRMMKTGSFNPHFFDYPSGYIYVQLGVAIVNFLVGAARHSWNNVSHVGPSDFYLWGRFATAAIGTATIALVYRVGLRWGVRVGLAAAALLAVMPMHVRESHFVLTDVPVTFAVALALLLSLRASEQPTLRAFLAAGAAAGLAAGIKYNSVVAFSMPLVAALAVAERRTLPRTSALLAAAAGCVAAFLVTTPFALFDLPAFLNGFGALASAYTARPQASEASWIIYAKHLRQAFGWPAAILLAGGLLITARRAVAGHERVKWALLLVFPVVYFYVINGWAYIFARYALPLVPFLVVWAAIALDWAAGRLAVPALPAAARGATAVLVLLAVVPGALGSIAFLRAHGTQTTQALAWAWMQKSIWPGSSVLSEAQGLDLPPERYKAETVRSLAGRDPESIVAAGVEWVVLSSDAWQGRVGGRGSAVPDAYAPIFLRATSAMVFGPTARHPGPTIHILRLSGR